MTDFTDIYNNGFLLFQFIDDASISSSSRPIYALLISREIEADQSYLNDDGLTPEERQRIKDQKEEARIKKQVEADLGGFDVEQEWVEEIEREDCFEIDSRLGLAPPLPTRKYEVWLVDAASQWSILDTYQLDDFEHGTAMRILYLTDVRLQYSFTSFPFHVRSRIFSYKTIISSCFRRLSRIATKLLERVSL